MISEINSINTPKSASGLLEHALNEVCLALNYVSYFTKFNNYLKYRERENNEFLVSNLNSVSYEYADYLKTSRAHE